MYALADKHEFDSPEQFGQILTKHFVTNNKHVTSARVEIAETRWERLATDNGPHEQRLSNCWFWRTHGRCPDKTKWPR